MGEQVRDCLAGTVLDCSQFGQYLEISTMRHGLLLLAVAVILLHAVVAKSCTGNLAVTIAGKYTWQSSNDTAYPSGAHFSPMVCAFSTTSGVFVSGKAASQGLKLLAETGDASQLQKELADAKISYKTSNMTASGTADIKLTLVLSPNATYLSCVSMIAPSPDWIVGIPSMDICDPSTGTYKTMAQYSLTPYDAGTDSGKNYTAANQVTSPTGVVASATDGVIAQYGYIHVTTNATGTTSSDGTADDSDSNSCFPAEAVVEIAGGALKRMDELILGDRVRVNDNEYSSVFMFTHKRNTGMHNFIRIETSDSSIEISLNHYIYRNGELVAAKGIRIGDVLQLASGASTVVTGIAAVKRVGLYNPQTLHGDIIVNGIVTSTYTTSVQPVMAHALLSPLRALYARGITSILSTWLDTGAPSLASIVPSGMTLLDA